MNDDETRDLSRSVETANALPKDATLLRMENETLMSVARAQPREPAKIIKQLRALIESYPQAAHDAVYKKPVGTVTQVICGDCSRKDEVSYVKNDWECPSCGSRRIGAQKRVKKYAEGLSIRAAESMRTVIGYTRLSVTVDQQGNGYVKITGTLVDYAAGNITSDERIVSPVYKTARGEMKRHDESRFWDVVVKAEKSRLRRDIILDSIDGTVKAAFRDACEKEMAKLVDGDYIETKIVPRFSDYGVSLEDLEALIGRPVRMGWREQDRLELQKIYSALSNGEVTVADLLDGLHADLPPSEKQAPSGVSRTAQVASMVKADAGQEADSEEPKKRGRPKKKKEESTEAAQEPADSEPVALDRGSYIQAIGMAQTEDQVSKISSGVIASGMELSEVDTAWALKVANARIAEIKNGVTEG